MAGAKAETSTLSLSRYAAEAKAWVVSAQALADERGHAEVSPAHLLVRGVERHPGVKEVFRLAGVDVVDLATLAERALGTAERAAEPSYLSARLLDLLRRAEREAEREKAAEVSTAHVLRALAQEVRGPAGEVLGALGIGPGSLDPHLAALRAAARTAPAFAPAAEGPAETRDLVALAAGADPVVGRAAELARLLTILERREKCHPLLVGEPGVGKSAIVRGLAARIARGEVPKRLAGARLLEIDVGHLLSGARSRSEVDARLRRIVDGAAGTSDPILFLPSIEQLFGQGTLATTTGDALRSAVERGTVRLLATTTPEGVRRLAEKDGSLLRELTLLEVSEPSPASAIEIVRGVAARLESHHAVKIADGAVVASVTLAKRYVSDRFLPDSALDLLDESAAALRVEVDGFQAKPPGAEGTSGQAVPAAPSAPPAEAAPSAPAAPPAIPLLTEEHVALMLGSWTGIPVAKMLEGEADKLLRMEERLERRVVGQSEGVRALARAVRRGRVGLRDPRRPIGSFLFLGPSGVGKTELAKALAEFLFDDEAALTRLDMSEFMERHMAQRLLGAPPGYADSEQGGFLTEAVRRRPYSVLLFDEVEKAHGDVFNLLLQVLDDGRLTDGRGRLADFTNTVVILTSNIGSERILEADPGLFEKPEGRDALRDVLLEQLGKFFRPEFLNRIDDVIVFRPLSKEDLRRIVDIQLAGVSRLLAPRKVSLDVDDAAKDLLVDLGYQPALGARPLRRAILKHVQDPLAEKLLESQAAEGATVSVRAVDGALRLEVVPPAR